MSSVSGAPTESFAKNYFGQLRSYCSFSFFGLGIVDLDKRLGFRVPPRHVSAVTLMIAYARDSLIRFFKCRNDAVEPLINTNKHQLNREESGAFGRTGTAL